MYKINKCFSYSKKKKKKVNYFFALLRYICLYIFLLIFSCTTIKVFYYKKHKTIKKEKFT